MYWLQEGPFSLISPIILAMKRFLLTIAMIEMDGIGRFSGAVL